VLPAHPALLRAINMEQASRLISSIGNVPEFFQQQYDKDQPKSAESFLSPDELLHLQADLRTLHAKISLTDEDIAHVVRMATVKTLSNGAVIMREDPERPSLCPQSCQRPLVHHRLWICGTSQPHLQQAAFCNYYRLRRRSCIRSAQFATQWCRVRVAAPSSGLF
jgi:hypothetical protein